MGMTTYLIAQTLDQLNRKLDLKGKLTVWMGDYKFIIGYDCIEQEVCIQEVYKGIFLSNDLVASPIPKRVRIKTFKRLMKPLLELRGKEIAKEIIRLKKEEEEERRQLKLEEETENRIDTEEYLNDTFGLY